MRLAVAEDIGADAPQGAVLLELTGPFTLIEEQRAALKVFPQCKRLFHFTLDWLWQNVCRERGA